MLQMGGVGPVLLTICTFLPNIHTSKCDALCKSFRFWYWKRQKTCPQSEHEQWPPWLWQTISRLISSRGEHTMAGKYHGQYTVKVSAEKNMLLLRYRSYLLTFLLCVAICNTLTNFLQVWKKRNLFVVFINKLSG